MFLIERFLVDPFTLYHVLMWAAIGALCRIVFRASLWQAFLFGLGIGILWELAEIYIEIWIGFKEPIYNRWLTDPLADVIGTLLGWLIAKRLTD